MYYYDSSGKLINCNLDMNDYDYCGKSGMVFRLEDDCCLKQYFSYSTENVKMSSDIFTILKELNHPNVYKLIELYYNVDIKDSVEAYKYRYVESSPIDIINESTEYLLYNLEELEKLVDTFSDLKIWLKDIKKENAVLTDDRIVLIDLDCCKLARNNTHCDINENNKLCLQELFLDLIVKTRNYSDRYEHELNELFLFDINDSLSSCVSKKLVKFKTLKDYIKR